MRLRPYIPSRDFAALGSWITDRREHALWCAYRFPFPLERESFDSVLCSHAERFGDCAFTAISDDGEQVGFFCFSVNTDTNDGMLKFVVVSPSERGKGAGKEMLRSALRYAFDIAGAESVRLFVFDMNTAARRCYESVGFELTGSESGAFVFHEESWGRCEMKIRKQKKG